MICARRKGFGDLKLDSESARCLIQRRPVENKTSNPVGRNASDAFLGLSVCYLGLPNILFLLTWVRPAIGIPAALLVGWSCLRVAFAHREPSPSQTTLDTRTLVFVISAGLIWTTLAGAGGLVPQSADYPEHNLIFHDLAHEKWPVIYDIAGRGRFYFCYCVGYYLIPSLAAHFLGDSLLPVLTFAWTATGVCLFFYWIATLNKASKRFLVLVLFYAGTGVLWYLFKQEKIPGLPRMHDPSLADRLTAEGLIHSYLDFSTKFFFTPQHAVASTLATAVLYEMLWIRKNATGAGFVWASALLWSTLSSLGLLLIPLMAVRRVPWKQWFAAPNILGGGTLVAIMAIFYHGHLKLEISGPIWSFPNAKTWPLLYCLFLVTQLLPVVFVALIDKKYGVLKDHRAMFWGAVAMLAVLPFYRLGFESDLRLQAATPALIVVALAVGMCLTSEAFSCRRPLFLALTFLYCVGALYPAARPVLNLVSNRHDRSYAYLNRTQGVRYLTDLAPEWGYDFAIQYLGRLDSPAYRWLLKRPSGDLSLSREPAGLTDN